MHISDGILSPLWVGVWYVVALLFLVLGVREVTRRAEDNPSYVPLLAMMGAAVFVISVWHIPVPVTGSSSHPVGTPLAAIVVGPYATIVVSAIVLSLQMFIGHGGLTTLGANIVSMGIVGPLTGYGTYRLLENHAGLAISAGAAGAIGSMCTYLTTALELALSLNPENVLRYWLIYSMGFVPTQLPLVVVEGVFTAIAVKYVLDRRPDLIDLLRGEAGA